MEELDLPVAGDKAAINDDSFFFETKQLVEDATKQQLNEQVSRAEATTKQGIVTEDERQASTVFVVEWLEDVDGQIVGLGSDADGCVRYLKLKCCPGVFVATSDAEALRVAMGALGYETEEYTFLKYRCNNFTPLDTLFDADCATAPCFLAKVFTPSVCESMKLYRRFRDDPYAYRYASVPFYWNVTTQVVFERMLRFHETNRNTCDESGTTTIGVPKVTMRWFDDRLTCHSLPEPTFPVVTFDIETVSTAKARVPRGDNEDDELFSVSVHHVATNIMYTLIYLPYLDSNSPYACYDRSRHILKTHSEEKPNPNYESDFEAKQIAENMLYEDGYPSYEDEAFSNKLEVFTSERELLIRTMDLLRPRHATNGKDLMHYLVGYNSMSYDMRYLLLRCSFYNLECSSRFIYRNGFCFGFSQLHLDLFRIIVTQYRFKRYRLNDVAQELLKEGKTGVDAVQLRYTFHGLRHRGRYMNREECGDLPSLPDILHYNNYDTYLVSKLLQKTRSIDFVVNQAHEARIPLSSLNVNYNRMRYKLWCRCFVVGLELGLYLSTFKSATVCERLLPLGGPTQVLHLDQQLQGDARRHVSSVQRDTLSWQEKQKKLKYPGGANFCLGEYHVRDVQVLDYRIAYPLAIERLNISDETATVLPASLLASVCSSLSECQRKSYRLFDYMAHTGATRPETHLLYYQYIYHGLHCGGEFPFEHDELVKRHNQPVTVIWQGRRGLLSDIISRFNTMREDVKSMRNAVQAVVQRLRSMSNDVEELRRMQEAEEEASEAPESQEKRIEDQDDDEFDCFDALLNGNSSSKEEVTKVANDIEEAENEDFSCFDEFVKNGAETDEKEESRDKRLKNNGVPTTQASEGDEFSCFDQFLGNGENVHAKKQTQENSETKPTAAGSNNDDEDEFSCFDEFMGNGVEKCDAEPTKASSNDDDEDEFSCFDEFMVNGEEKCDAEPTKASCNDDDEEEFSCFDNMFQSNVANENETKINSKDGQSDDDDFSCFDVMCGRDKAADTETESERVAVTTRNTSVVTEKKKKTLEAAVDPLISELSFCNRYFEMQRSRTLRVVRETFESLSYSEQLKIIAEAVSAAEYDAERLSNRYTLMKALVASIYGCIGTSAKVCAALVTCTIRSTLLMAAQHMVRCGYTVYYMDTDSLFVKHPTRTDDPSAELNKMFPYTEIEMKPYPECMFVRKKTYYTAVDGVLKYSQHANGPPCWSEFVQFAYGRDDIANNSDVDKMFRDFFRRQYDRLQSFTRVDEDFLRLVGQEVRIKESYKSNTNLAKLRDYLTRQHPDAAVQKRHIVYYELTQDVTSVRFRPTFELRDVSQLRDINLFKYYQNVFKTVYNVISFHLKRNNAPYMISVSERPVLSSMISAFLDEHRSRFPDSHVTESQLRSLSKADIRFLDLSDDDEDMNDFECDFAPCIKKRNK